MRPTSRFRSARVRRSIQPAAFSRVRMLTFGLTASSLALGLRAATELPKMPFRVGAPPRGWLGEGEGDRVDLPVAPARSRGELFFIDAEVADPRAFWLAAPSGATVVCIPAGVDSWQFMAQEAEHFRGLGAIHIISHGEPGALVLNGRRYAAADLDARSLLLRQLGQALTKNGDILLYGCDTGEGAAGAMLVTRLADFTGADVAASSNPTGGLPGADWNLEVAHGVIETPAIAPVGYEHELATFSDSTISGLRADITTAIGNGQDNTITLTGNIIAGSSDVVTGPDGKPALVVINNTGGHTLTIDGGGKKLDAGHYGRVLYVQAGAVNALNLTITNGLLSGNGGTTGNGVAADQNARGAGILNAGTLQLNGVTITANKAAGGGGGGGISTGVAGGGGGGGGGGFSGIGGGTGGSTFLTSGTYAGVAGSGGTGGRGGSYDGTHFCGIGGSSTGGAGGSGSYSAGGNGGTASNGTISIGGGGGGQGFTSVGGAGGPAVGGIFNSGTLTVFGSSSISNNLGAGGGGGGGGASGYAFNGGAGGQGVGGLWNTGTLHIAAAVYSGMSGNAAASGTGGSAPGGSAGTTPASSPSALLAGATNDTSYVAPTATVTSISPASGTTAGGTSVTITGTNLTGATAVKFGSTSASSYTVNSATSITATSPAGSVGAVDITVTTFYATSATGAGDQFTYVAPPVVNSTLTATGTYGSAIGTYTITATNSPTSYNATGLPTGLSVNTANGQITGTPTATAGSPYSVTISATNGGVTGNATLVFTVNKANLTVSGITASGKTYDGAATGTLNVASAVLNGAVNSDSLTLVTGSATGAFPDRNVGVGRTVTVSGLSVTGANSTNYTLTQPTTTATIAAKALSVTGLTATGTRIYDGTTTAGLSGTPVFATAEATGTGTTGDGVPYTVDAVSVGGTAAGAFADRHVGTGKAITVSGLSVSGTGSTNYTLTAPAGLSAAITAKALTVSGVTAAAKTYDGTTGASVSGTASLPTAEAVGAGTTVDGKPYTGDTVSASGTATGAFVDRNAGVGKTVNLSGLSLTGANSTDYSLTAPTTTATIAAKALSVTGLTATGTRIYDGTTTAGLSGTPVFATAEATGTGTTGDGVPYTVDAVSVGGTAAGAFADRNVGPGKAITVSGLSVSGTGSTNYTLTAPAGLSAAITAKALTVSGVTAAAKTYDGTTGASVSGTASLPTAEAVGAGTTVDGKPYTGDTVSASGTATGAFVDRNAGVGKTVNLSGLSLTGANSTDYSLTAPTTTATIAAKALSVTGLTATGTRIYDGTTTAGLSGTPVFATAEATGTGTTGDGVPYTVDAVSVGGTAAGAFADRNVGPGKAITVTGLSVAGTDSGNYSLTAPSGLSGAVTAKALTVTGLSALAKTHDGTTGASVSGTAVFGTAEATGTGSTADGLPYTVDTIGVGGTASGTFVSRNAGAGVGVAVSGLTVSGTDGGNYTVTPPAGLSATITAKALTVTGLTATSTRVYDGTTIAGLGGTPAFTAAESTGTGGTGDGIPYSVDAVSVGGTAAGAFVDRNVGAGKAITVTGLSVSGTGSGNYTLTSPAGLSESVTAKALSVTGLTATGTRIYDGTTTAGLSGTPVFATAEATGTGTTGDGVPYTVDAVSVGGTAAGAFADRHVGTGKAITVSGLSVSGTGSTNYTLTAPAGLSAAITAKALTVSGVTAAAKTYDGTTGASVSGTASLPTAEAVGAGTTVDGKPYTGDTVSASGTATGAFVDRNAGVGKTVNLSGLSLTGANSTDYSLTAPTTTATIAAKALSVTGLTATGTRIYDGTTTAGLSGTPVFATAEATGTGTTGDGVPYTVDAVSVGGTAAGAFADRNVGPGKAITVTGLSVAGTDSGNYSLTAPSGLSGAVTAKALTVTGLSALAKTYDGTTAASLSGTAVFGTAEATGTGSTADGLPYTVDTIGVGGTASGTFVDSNVGAGKTVTVTGLTVSGTDSANYSLTQPTPAANIAAKPITVTAGGGQTKVFGAADPIFTYTITSGGPLVTGDSFSGALGRTAGTAVGGYAINQGNLALSSNYALTFVPATFTITAKGVIVTADSGQTKVYGAADPTFTYTVTSGALVSGDSFSGALSRATGENVGSTYAIGQGTLAAGSNYALTFVPANFAITAKPITVTANSGQTKVYGAADPTFTYTLTGGGPLVTGDSLSGALSRAAGENVGSTYAIGQGTLTAGGNYALTFVPANFAITKANLTVTADNQSRAFQAANPTLTATITGFAFTDTAASALTGSAALTTTADATSVPGTYPITAAVGTLAATNYSFTFADGTLTVTPTYHSADTNGDWQISLLELTRVIQLYNTTNGTTRTGEYHSQSGTEDGYAPGAGTVTTYHSADEDHDGKISLMELTRVIQLYNTTNGTTRTGAYHQQNGTEDGYAPGP